MTDFNPNQYGINKPGFNHQGGRQPDQPSGDLPAEAVPSATPFYKNMSPDEIFAYLDNAATHNNPLVAEGARIEQSMQRFMEQFPPEAFDDLTAPMKAELKGFKHLSQPDRIDLLGETFLNQHLGRPVIYPTL